MDTNGLAYQLIIKLNAKVMITVNIDVEDKLCNGQIGTIRHIKYDNNGNVQKIYLQMEDPEVGLKAMHADNYGHTNELIPIKINDQDIKIKKNRASSPVIKRFQFPLMLSWSCTVHKVQGKQFPQVVFSFQLLKQRRFNTGQVYVALSRSTSLKGLYLTGQFNEKSITADIRVTNEYERMRNHSRLIINDGPANDEQNSLKFCLLNIRSLKKHSIDIKMDQSLNGNNLIFFTETQLTSDSDLSTIEIDLPNYYFQHNFSDNHRFSSLASANDRNVEIITLQNLNGASLYSVSHAVLDKPINVMLLYRQNHMRKEDFLYLIHHLQGQVDSVQIILGDFNIDYLKPDSDFLRNNLNDYEMIVDGATHISGTLIDHIYIEKDFEKRYDIKIHKTPVYYSDHDATIVKISVKDK